MEAGRFDTSMEEEISMEQSKCISKTWNTLEPEILEKILAHFHNPSEPAEMAKLREVCKLWRDVIDEHFKFEVTLNDEEMDVTRLSHLRVTPSVEVSSLDTQQLDPNSSVFRNTSEISELKITGTIITSNFQHLLNEAVNLSQLSLHGFWTPDLLVPAPGMDAQFLETWRQLSSLEITISDYRNLLPLLPMEMANLNTFKLEVVMCWPTLTHSALVKTTKLLFSFLDRCLSLRVLHLLPFPRAFGSQDNTELPVYTGDKQLDTLKLTTFTSVLRCWLPLVKVQKSLKDLYLCVYTIEYPRVGPFPEELCFCTSLEATLRLNETTLTSIHFENLSLSSNLNAALFENMSSLKRLVLFRFNWSVDEFSLIFNLGKLPNSIEVLNLGGFTYEPADLEGMADRLVNAEVVELVYMRESGNEIPSTPRQVLESFGRKEKIQSLKLSPAVTSILNDNPYEFRDGRFYLLLNGSVVACDFYREPSALGGVFNFNFGNN